MGEHCHNKVTECSLCEQKFVTKNVLKNHIKQIHLSETSTCHICHKEYKDLYHHVKYFHEKIRNYECSYCEKKFQAKKLLYNHVQSIHLGEKTNCPDCKKDISVDNFSRHVRETHERVRLSTLDNLCCLIFVISRLRSPVLIVKRSLLCLTCPGTSGRFTTTRVPSVQTVA